MAIYCVGYITVKKSNECDNIKSVNPFYLMIYGVIGHIEEKNQDKYLNLSPYNELIDK